MPGRLTPKDRRFIRLALLLAIESEDSMADAYSGHSYDKEQTDHAKTVQERSAKNIAEFRRLLERFGGPEGALPAGKSIPLTDLMNAPTKEFCSDCTSATECNRYGCQNDEGRML